jgi:PAS domain S-box-containing protein
MQPQAATTTTTEKKPERARGDWLVADGTMGRRIREFAWETTSLGPWSTWSTTLQTATNVMLATPVPMVLLWGPELVVMFNDAYLALAIERDVDPFGHPARAVWADRIDVAGPIYDHLLAGGAPLEFKDQHYRVRRNGVVDEAWFTLSYAAVRIAADAPIGVMIVVHETTRYMVAERRLQESQQLLRDIVDSTPAIIFAMDRQQHYMLVNDEMSAFVRQSKDELIGKPVRAIFPPETAELLSRANVEILRTGNPVHTETTLVPVGSERPRTVLVTKFAIRNAGGDITGVGGVATDITERKRHEDDVRRQKARAEESARMKAAFLDIAAHELRTPITILSLVLQLYEDTVKDDGTIGAVELARLREPVDRLSRLVVELLNVARLERGMVVLQRRPTDVRTLVDTVVAEFRLLAPARDVRVTTPDEPVVADVDPVRLNQVIANLLDNARKYAPAGPIEVHLDATPTSVRIAVVDHGPGIAAGSLDGLFEAFSRGHADLVDDGTSGLGLGLSVCKGIVELHGGHIDVVSEVGLGCRFTVELPRHPA